ncbi:5-hydroxytryptamine receptor 6-like [Oculina patagonica]
MINNSSVSISPQQPNAGMQSLSKLLPIAIAIIVTNGLVFVMFYRRKSLRTSSNYLLFGLAICDFLTGAINIPYFIVFSFQIVPQAMSKNFGYWMYVLHTLMAVSAGYHILIITAEKYLAITKPLRHHLVTKKTVYKILAGIWMISAFIAIIPVAWEESSSRLLWYIIHASVSLFIVFFAPYGFIVYAFTVMFRVISKRQRPKIQNDNTRLRFQAKKNNDRKCIVIFAIMATMFAICWLPYFTIMLISYVKQYQSSGFPASMLKAFEVFAIVRYMTSITNPLLYTFFKRDFCLALKTLLGNFTKTPERLRSLSLSLRRTHDITRPVSLDKNLILLVSWNRVNSDDIGLEASYTVSEEQVQLS